MYEPELLQRESADFEGALFVDLGYGFWPTTTLESAARFRKLNPSLPVLGVEIDRLRVREAQRWADEITHFRVGGFNLPLVSSAGQGIHERVRAVRAFNVLRQYSEEAYAESLYLVTHNLLPRAILIEGTSDRYGRIWVSNVFRKLERAKDNTDSAKGSIDLALEALVFSTNFKEGFEPGMFQPVLPKNLIHHMTPGHSIYQFFEAWKLAYEEVGRPLASWSTVRHVFMATAQRLAQQRQEQEAQPAFRIDTRKKWLSKGYLIWYLRDCAYDMQPL